MSKFREPWKSYPIPSGTILNSESKNMGHMANGVISDRAVACVNALADVKNPEVVKELFEYVASRKELIESGDVNPKFFLINICLLFNRAGYKEDAQ